MRLGDEGDGVCDRGVVDDPLEGVGDRGGQGPPDLDLVTELGPMRVFALLHGARAALINLAETLYQDLRESGVAVSVVNPGFVETPLTAQNEFEMPGLMKPDAAAREMLRGWARGDFETHFPKRFTLWMKLLRLLPYALFFPAVRRITGL